jgi:squalene-associated FAD-dependent desaturase
MTVHIVGAGLSGLAAAVALAEKGQRVVLYEAAAQAGGRCRSYHDREIDRVIDNGNHLVLSGNENVQRYLRLVGASDRLVGPAGEGFRFLDLTKGRGFTVRPNDGPIPWWIGVPSRRVPDTGILDYLAAIRLAFARIGSAVADILPHDEVYRVLWEPLAVSALNTPVEEASAQGFWRVLAKTLARGGAFARPLIARETLADTFVAPGLAFLAERSGIVRLGTRIKRLAIAEQQVNGLMSESGDEEWAPGDQLIMAAPPAIAERLVPGLEAPGADEPIVNAHFATSDPDGTPLEVVAIVGGAAHWVFRRPGLASVTVSAARAMVDEPAETLAPRLWADVARAFPALGATMPPYRIIKEKRATIRQSPADEAIRPSFTTKFDNLWLAGDWTRTGLPATIEGSLLSGFRAAEAALKAGR